MFPYIKITLLDGGEMWIHYKTISQVYYDADDGTTTISTTTGDTDFSVQDSIEYIVQKLKTFYPDSKCQQSIEEDTNNLINASYLDIL